jgi:hypothetical protein
MSTTQEQINEAAVAALEARRANVPKQINNSELYAGSPMYFYCQCCGHQSDVLPEAYFLSTPRELCKECQAMSDRGLIRPVAGKEGSWELVPSS